MLQKTLKLSLSLSNYWGPSLTKTYSSYHSGPHPTQIVLHSTYHYLSLIHLTYDMPAKCNPEMARTEGLMLLESKVLEFMVDSNLQWEVVSENRE